MGQLEGIPPPDLVGADELATVLANMGEYGQPSSPAGLCDEPPEEDTLEKSNAEKAGEENLPIHDEKIGETNREQSVPKTPEEIPDEEGADLRASHEPSVEVIEIKKLRKKKQGLLNTIAQLRQQIRTLKANQRIQRATEKRKRATAAKSHREKRQRTNSRPADQDPAGNLAAVSNDIEEQTAVPNDTEEQTVVPNDTEEQTNVPNDTEERTTVSIKTEE